ncbi:multiple epidermal growth factor-like domains protein 10 [Saccostrea cucullata]|uniref:multiple epidermal growth factor-like domains protein 10 n=1 Tax=Saccostrea cuccullata TaxID=36930 RepID=UPI002ED1A897
MEVNQYVHNYFFTVGVDASPISSTTSGVLPDNDGAGHVFLVDNGTICGENFGTGDAMVICLIWGFIPDYPSYRKVNMSSRILLNDPECKGDEVSINECPMGGRNCSSGESVSVKCNEGNTFAGFSVYVSDTEDFKSGHACHYHAVEEIPSNTISFPCITSGRYVTIFNSRNATQLPSLSEWAYINICELNVAGCDFGFYGGECSRCPGNCLDDNCHVQTGLCSGCKDGFTGPTCTTECSAGLYGPNCSLTCAQCRDGESCNNINGACPNGCSAGWMGEQCNLSKSRFQV